MKDDWDSPKEEVMGPTRQPEGCLARPPLLVAPGTLLDAWWPPSAPLSPIIPPGVETPKEELLPCFAAARCGNLQRRKAISGGQIPPGRSPPGRGDRRHQS